MILIRQDPPFDMNYIYSLQLLSTIQERVRIVNNPRSLLIFGEKLIPCYIENGKYMPNTLITDDIKHVKAFLAQHSTEDLSTRTTKRFITDDRLSNKPIILKNLWGYSGIGIKKVTKADEIEIFMANNVMCNPVVAQEFLPQIVKGDVRVTIMDGEVICAISRIPAPGAFISNLYAGATAIALNSLDARSAEICKAVGEFLLKHDIFLAGVDIIDGFLIEVNITSVGAITHSNHVHGKNLEKILVDKLEAKML